MKIWCQTYEAIGDSKLDYVNEALKRQIARVARSDTQVDIKGVEKRPPKMIQSRYLQSLNVAQVVEKALQAEREGYDAYIIAGMRDFGYKELGEVVDIPVTFIAEASYHLACFLAPKFSVVCPGDDALRGAVETIRLHGLEGRYVPGAHIGINNKVTLLEAFEKTPQRIVDMVSEAAKKLVDQGADVIVPAFLSLNVFLAEQGVKKMHAVPVLDTVAAVIKTTEMMVDLARLDIKRHKRFTRQEIMTGRKVFGLKTF